MDRTISILATTFFGVTISAGTVLYVGNTYDISITKKTPIPEIVNRPIVQIPSSSVQSVGSQKSSQLCNALASMSTKGITLDRSTYVMAVTGNDQNILDATQQRCPQYF